MKNAAKCDTWCELQNPVNHRVFERKLRPKPFGQGHACLGVTHTSPHPLDTSGVMGAEVGLLCALRMWLAQNACSRQMIAMTIGGCKDPLKKSCAVLRRRDIP